MKNGTVNFENRSKANLKLQNNLETNYANLENFHDVLLDLIDDEEFIKLCEAGNKYKTIMYLADKNIIKVNILLSSTGKSYIQKSQLLQLNYL